MRRRRCYIACRPPTAAWKPDARRKYHEEWQDGYRPQKSFYSIHPFHLQGVLRERPHAGSECRRRASEKRSIILAARARSGPPPVFNNYMKTIRLFKTLKGFWKVC